ncbi:hypothetical protein EVAR_44712_1 [Eumeta japonica]|uniref:Uncharacterized protein n=1 Tax=Eumeta variegata TaxID=151549 RepID=A0A4C1XKQ2_EUMVA|nr:hypothetical protein EVAR_44712_1 [Eumeta japonica]
MDRCRTEPRLVPESSTNGCDWMFGNFMHQHVALVKSSSVMTPQNTIDISIQDLEEVRSYLAPQLTALPRRHRRNPAIFAPRGAVRS